MDERVFGRHEYTWWFRAAVTTGLVSPFVWAFPFFFAEGDISLISVPLLLLGLGFMPLVIRYNTFAMTIADEEIHVESWRKKITYSVEDIVELRTREASTRESTYVRIRQGARFSFEHGLQNYEHIKEYLLEASLLSRRQEDKRKAIGTHRYRKSYLVLLSLVVVTLSYIVVRNSSSVDFDSVSVVIVVGLILVPMLCLVVRDLAFVLRVDEEGIDAKWVGSKRVILFTDIKKIEGGEWDVTLTDSSKRKIDFHRLLENFEHVREYLFRSSQAGRVTDLKDLLQ